MKTIRMVLSSILILWCADVLAHGTPAAHFCPGSTADPCEGRGCDTSDEYIGGHGHIDDYDDDNSNGQWDIGEENQWGYWTKGGYEATGNSSNNCSNYATPPPPPPRSSSTPPPTAQLLDLNFVSVLEAEDSLKEVKTPEVSEPLPAPKVQTEYQLYIGWNLFLFLSRHQVLRRLLRICLLSTRRFGSLRVLLSMFWWKVVGWNTVARWDKLLVRCL